MRERTATLAKGAAILLAILAISLVADGMAFGAVVPSESIIQWSLLLVVSVGVLVASGMCAVTVRRWMRYDPCLRVVMALDDDSVKSEVKRRIGCLTIRRAFRVEVGFLLCQLARLAHTVHVIRRGYVTDTTAERALAALEREFVTMMLVYLSLADLLDARRQATLQDQLYPVPPMPL